MLPGRCSRLAVISIQIDVAYPLHTRGPEETTRVGNADKTTSPWEGSYF
jgi:hypothetical protein